MQTAAIGQLGADDDRIDQAILALLLHGPEALWAEDELIREIGDELAVHDSLARLYGAGLVHRLEGFAFASRAAVRAIELAD